MSAEIQIGQSGRDRVTGFSGTCVGIATYISGCTQACIAPKIGNDGAFRQSEWFDIQRIAVEDGTISLENGRTPGPDREAPKR